MVEDALASLAEIAITLAGFTGVVAAFRSRGSTLREQLMRITYVFLLCFIVIVSSYLPTIIVSFSGTSNLVWQVPLTLLGVSAIGIFLHATLQIIRSGITLRFPVLSYGMLLGLFLIGLLCAFASFDLLPGSQPGYLLFAEVWFIVHAGWVFVTTLFWAQETDE